MSAAVEAAADEPFLVVHAQADLRAAGHGPHRAPTSTTEPSPDLATAYFPRFAADPRYGPDLMRAIDLSCYSGASVFLSTPSDLVRFGMAINSGKLLQPATVQLLQTSLRLPSGEETGYGLGWDLETVDAGRVTNALVGHDGECWAGWWRRS